MRMQLPSRACFDADLMPLLEGFPIRRRPRCRVVLDTPALKVPMTAVAVVDADSESVEEVLQDRLPVRLHVRDAAQNRHRIECESLSAAVAQAQVLLAIPALVPRFAYTFLRQEWTLPDGARLSFDLELRFHSLLDDRPLELAEDECPRLKLRTGGAPPPPKLWAALEKLAPLPVISKRWTGEYFMRRFYRPPVRNELPGFEYEAKLEAEHLEVDESCLPFPVIGRGQAQSVRWYKDGHRIAFRGGRASIVKKGPKVDLDGVLRRTEEKERGVWTFALDSEPVELRRYQRALFLHNPENDFVYALCLDRCTSVHASAPLLQVEIEYSGRLLLNWSGGREEHDLAAIVAAGQALEDVSSTRSLRFYERALALRRRSMGEPGPDVEALEAAVARLSAQPERELVFDVQIEEAVLRDVGRIRAALIARHGFVGTRMTKRRWLREVVEGAVPRPRRRNKSGRSGPAKKARR